MDATDVQYLLQMYEMMFTDLLYVCICVSRVCVCVCEKPILLKMVLILL